MKQLIQQVYRFAVVGVIATLIDFVILFILHRLFAMNYLIATAFAFIIATVFNYWASMAYIFTSKYSGKGKSKEFTIFLVLSVLGLGLTQLLMMLFVETFRMDVMVSKIFVTGFVMVFNFVSRKILLDSKEDTGQTGGVPKEGNYHER